MVRLFDILGPVMVGPSSSHTAGACRLGLMARAILGRTPGLMRRVLVHSGFPGEPCEEVPRELADAGHLPKGLPPEELLVRVSWFLGGASAPPACPPERRRELPLTMA